LRLRKGLLLLLLLRELTIGALKLLLLLRLLVVGGDIGLNRGLCLVEGVKGCGDAKGGLRDNRSRR